jgi:hypothetical protein
MTTASPEKTGRATLAPGESIAVVGGGITGLFCAYVLASTGHQVELFESSDQFGGRIRSFLLNRELMKQSEHDELKDLPQPLKNDAISDNLSVVKGEYENLEFCAEFGPMRVELDVQILLRFLLEHLGIGEEAVEGAHTDPSAPRDHNTEIALKAAHREPFPSFSSPTSAEDPLYQLRPDEEGKNPLELMSLALCRAVVHTTIADKDVVPGDLQKYQGSKRPPVTGYKQKREALIESLRNAAALQEPIGPVFDKWAKTLREDDFWIIARYGHIQIGDYDKPTRVPLYSMGFWNLMSIYLSHNALTKVRDLGTFYHLLPENPNAAHWLTWQLRSLSISGQLQGIYGGMQAITNTLLRCKMSYQPDPKRPAYGVCTVGTVTIDMRLNAHVYVIKRDGSGLKIELEPGGPHANPTTTYDRLILALPKAPAQELVTASSDLKDAHSRRRGADLGLPQLLDSSFGFPMVKVFFVVRDRWWEEAKRANWFATRFPTREVHYWKSRDPRSRRGMVMLYTDRPASSFWANYVPAGRQNDVEELCLPGGKHDTILATIRARLKQRLVQYINENHVPDITEADIIWCGIMDWGRLPYGAGNHAWRPERRFWEAMADLADITLGADESGPHVHVCGEAFADYTGFIEGSLRSATYTLTKILNATGTAATGELLKEILGVLKVDPDLLDAALGPKKAGRPKKVGNRPHSREFDYLEDLKSWVDSLNSC